MAANQNRIRIAPDFVERYPGASPTATEAAMNLVFTAELLIKRVAEVLQPFGLSPSAGLVLGILADAAAPLPPNAIADRLIISRATVTGLLDTLEKRGYARRVPHETDRRMLLVELSETGRQVAHELRLRVHQHQNTWLSAISEEEQKALTTALHRLQAALTPSEV